MPPNCFMASKTPLGGGLYLASGVGFLPVTLSEASRVRRDAAVVCGNGLVIAWKIRLPAAARFAAKLQSTRRGFAALRITRLWCLLAGLILAGCESVQDIRVDHGNCAALSPGEARTLITDGWALYAAQPRTLARVTQAAELLAAGAQVLRDDYDAQWPAAEAWAFVADNETRQAARIAAAKRGIMLARAARELQPDRVEGHYWYAITVGLLADADRTYGLKAVGEMEPALRRAIELDERYDYAGPVRVLGILVLRAPAPPVSIGSSRKGLRLLQHAAELVPDYPENILYLAEAFRDNHRNLEARELLTKVINAPPWPNRQFESAVWKTAAQVLLQCVPAN